MLSADSTQQLVPRHEYNIALNAQYMASSETVLCGLRCCSYKQLCSADTEGGGGSLL